MAIKPNNLEAIRVVKEKHEREWLALDGVISVGIGKTSRDVLGLIVSVKTNAAFVRNRIPEAIEGVQVEIRESGELKALS